MTRYLLTINVNSSEYLKYDFAKLKFNTQNTNLYRFESSNKDCLLNLLCDILDCFNKTLDTSDQLINILRISKMIFLQSRNIFFQK